MIRTVEAVIDADGTVRLLEAVRLAERHRALVTILDEAPVVEPNDAAVMSEQALAEDWNRPEEDEAWKHLQPAR